MISVSEILEGFSGDGWREEGGREEWEGFSTEWHAAAS